MLSRRLTPLHMLFLSINGIIGSAWLFAPLYVAQIAGGSALISWFIGGGATILIALTFAEVSTLLPVAGGTTRFAQLTQGGTTGFIISWVSWLSCVTMPPIEVQAVLQYASVYFPSLMHEVNHFPQLTTIGLIAATIIMFALCLLNIASFKGFIRFNFFVFSFKVFVIILAMSAIMHAQFTPANFFIALNTEQTSNHWQAILTAVATGGVAFAFTGFKHGVELAGETTHSQIAIPMAIVGSVIACLLLYIGLQIAFIAAVNPELLKNGWSALKFPHDVGPFIGIAGLLGLAWLVKLLLIDAVVSPLGAGLIYVTSTARIIYAMSRNGYLPAIFLRLNHEKFPTVAIFFNFAIGMLLFLPLPGWQNMVSFLVSAVVISYAMGPISLMCLRQQLPQQPRPFRLPFAHVICLIAFYCCNLISFWTGWDTMSKLALAIALGIACFIMMLLRQSRSAKPEISLDAKALIWVVPYLSGLIILSYLGEYGGRHIITFGWDFLIIALFSVVIFYLAIYTQLSKTSVHQQLTTYLQEHPEASLLANTVT